MSRIALLLAVLMLAGCAVGGPVSSSQPKSKSQGPEELLCQELSRRGIGEYDSSKLVPYDDNINGCFSYTEDRREWDRSEILVYRCDTEPGDYEILAITKDYQIFFIMSKVDGVLNDIRDTTAYIHDGEYTQAEAQAELERYLREETDIDPGEYDILCYPKWIDGRDNYLIELNEKDAAPGDGHAYKFYVSKDLRRIARVDYRDEPGTNRHSSQEIDLEPGFPPSSDVYTQEEIETVLLGWIQQNLLPQAKAEDVRYGYMYRHKMPVYVYQIPVEDGAGYEFFVPASMEGASYCLLTSSEEMFPVPHYVYLKDGS